MIYLDYNATTMVHPEVIEVMIECMKNSYGNPSSSHKPGFEAKKIVENSRKEVAQLIGCDTDEIFFTSGGTESNNFALKGLASKFMKQGKHIITSITEHPSVIEVCKYLEKTGFEISYLPVNEKGYISFDTLKKTIRKDTILISIMLANNETGVIQPIADFAEYAKLKGIFFHTDAAQAIGKIDVNVKSLNIDILSAAGHKFYAPKGVGFIYARRGVSLDKIMHGASHEFNQRAGTENVVYIAGLGKACELVGSNLANFTTHSRTMRDRLCKQLIETGLDFRVNSDLEKGLPNTLNISFRGVEANTLMAELNDDLAVSAGAACHAEEIDLSPVIEAMNVPLDYAMGTLRFSVGIFTTEKEIDRAVSLLKDKVKNLVSTQPFSELSEDKSSCEKLTRFTHGLGCACKIKPQILESILSKITFLKDDNIIIGTENSDDAAVYRINNDLALVATLDFFTPIVDDPYSFGAIAAANALSDIYAMGAEPLIALNIVGFPVNRLPLSVLEKILKGASDKATEAGIAILGGHSIEDTEPKYGMVVIGKVNPERAISNCNLKINDNLILTKPLGTGILTTALKKGIINQSLEKKVIQVMSTLNKYAAKIMNNYPINACTDVTGFGLLGHLKEMLSKSEFSAVIEAKKVPVIEGVKEIVEMKVIPGGTINNHKYVNNIVHWSTEIPHTKQIILCDAQTSGGLLISIPEKEACYLLADLKNADIEAEIIGKVVSKRDKTIYVN